MTLDRQPRSGRVVSEPRSESVVRGKRRRTRCEAVGVGAARVVRRPDRVVEGGAEEAAVWRRGRRTSRYHQIADAAKAFPDGAAATASLRSVACAGRANCPKAIPGLNGEKRWWIVLADVAQLAGGDLDIAPGAVDHDRRSAREDFHRVAVPGGLRPAKVEHAWPVTGRVLAGPARASAPVLDRERERAATLGEKTAGRVAAAVSKARPRDARPTIDPPLLP